MILDSYAAQHGITYGAGECRFVIHKRSDHDVCAAPAFAFKKEEGFVIKSAESAPISCYVPCLQVLQLWEVKRDVWMTVGAERVAIKNRDMT